MGQPPQELSPAPANLGLWDATSIIVGIVIGVGIFEAPSHVLQNLSGPWEAMGAWVLGGLLSLIGALCFAELASSYPRSGGEYVYLTRAYGSWMGFLFAWAQLAVIRTGGGIAALAYVFANAAAQLWHLGPRPAVACAAGAIALLTVINALGVNPGKRTQNLLTVLKVVGLAGLVLAGLFWANPGPPADAPADSSGGSFALAMIFVLYTYDGWNEAVWVTAEVRDRRRNLPLALILGTLAVTVIYLAVNAALLAGLGFTAARSSPSLPADVLTLALGDWGGRAMHVLVMLSALGAVNGMIFTGSRIYPELGQDHRAFAPLARWNRRLGTPLWALGIQAAISMAMVVVVGVGWEGQNGFDALVKGTAPVFWLFFLLTGLSLFVLRRRDPEQERPFRVPGYPVTPLLFCGWCAYMLYGSITYARRETVVGLLILLAGLPFYLIPRRRAS